MKFFVFLFKKESTKYFEDEDGFVYKKVNENEKTVYFDCLNEPRCLVAARLYKQAKSLKMFGNHSKFCPPDSKMKMKIHFEEFLRKDVLEGQNVAVSVLNLYKRAIEERYKGIWLPENHRTNFLPVLRRLRNYHKTKPLKKSNLAAPKSKDVATSPIVPHSVGISNPKSPMPLGIAEMPTTSSGKSGTRSSSDMATSPKQNLIFVCEEKEGNSARNQLNASLDANERTVESIARNLTEQTTEDVAVSLNSQSSAENVTPKSPTLLDADEMASNVSMNMGSDMATSPMQFIEGENDETAASNIDGSLEDQLSELLDQHHFNICVKSNGNSTLSVVSSSSHLVAVTQKQTKKTTVNILLTFIF